MRRVLLLTLLALAACTPSQDTAGTGTPTSDPADLAKLGTQIDKSDQRIAAAVTVARENADKPEVVRAETGVALAYLPKPDALALDYVRNRVTRNNSEEYKRAEDAGRKLLAVIDANFAKAEQDAAALVVRQGEEPCGNLRRFVLPDVENAGGDSCLFRRFQQKVDVSQQVAACFTRKPQRAEAKLIQLGCCFRHFARIAMAQLCRPDSDAPNRGHAQNPISRIGEAKPLLTTWLALASSAGSSFAR